MNVACERGHDRAPMTRLTTTSATGTRAFYQCGRCHHEIEEPAVTASHKAYVEHSVLTIVDHRGVRTTSTGRRI